MLFKKCGDIPVTCIILDFKNIKNCFKNLLSYDSPTTFNSSKP